MGRRVGGNKKKEAREGGNPTLCLCCAVCCAQARRASAPTRSWLGVCWVVLVAGPIGKPMYD
jgi:hypothetical protein